MEQNNVNRIIFLTNLLNEYADSYYNSNISKVSDFEYDMMFDELKKLELSENFVLSNSPTQKVGYEVKSELTKVKHSHPMLSLDKTKSEQDLIAFAKDKKCILSLKMDGLTCLLTYENGELIRAETRGNGEIGEDITHNAKVITNIPLKIPYKEHFEIEGEVIITYKDFEKINESLPEDKKYKHPRNLAAGSIRQLDSSIAKQRYMKFIAWKVPGDMTESYKNGLTYARSLGFDVVPFVIYSNMQSDIINQFILTLKEKAEDLSYPIDGLVATYDDVNYGQSLGMTGHHPNHSIAFKFYNEVYETTLLDIEWSMGKTGTLSPVAIFEPVDIDGTTITRASVHNVSILTELDLRVGDLITIYKANEIIPKVYQNLSAENRESKHIAIPGTCPICGSPTVINQVNNSKVLLCTNNDCKGKLLGKLVHFVSRNAMNIDGLSDSTLQFLIDELDVKCFEDLYVIKNYKDDIKKWKHANGFGEKSVNKILESIEKSKTVTLDRFINALSIPNIGKSASKTIAKYFHYDFDEWYTTGILQLFRYTLLDDFGDTMEENLFTFSKNNKDMLLSLARHMNFVKPEETNNSSNVNGITFCITGSLNIFKNRDEAVQKIELYGGKVVGSVSKKTNYLVNNDVNSTSGKNKKAKELNVSIITEDELINMLGE